VQDEVKQGELAKVLGLTAEEVAATTIPASASGAAKGSLADHDEDDHFF
jgi:hypothetical protein